MAFDPIQEDCLRLVLGAMRRERIYPLENAAFIERCMEDFHADPARLIVHDRDRSFHLVAMATEIVDYRVPFIMDDTAADAEAAKAEAQLREACELDPANWDAKRMLAALEAESNDAYVSYLLDHRADVEADLARVTSETSTPYDREFAGDLGRRPYLRWLAAIASRALIAGQYRLALTVAEESLAYAPADPADVRHTAMLAMAKLEYPRAELDRFHKRYGTAYASPLILGRRHHLAEKSPDAWTLIAQLACAYHDFDMAGATRMLKQLMRVYPHSAEALYYQAEFPDGVFCRVNVEPGSIDELILALSEATPLLQEGLGSPSNACLSTWIATHERVQRELDGAPSASAHVLHPPHAGSDA